MDKRILGNDLEVSAIGLGCMGMSHAYGTVSTKKEAEELIAKAMDMGCTFFDTAEIYGSQDDPHHNERLLGDILKSHRQEIQIASKCGIRFDETATTVNKPLILTEDRRRSRVLLKAHLRDSRPIIWICIISIVSIQAFRSKRPQGQ